MQAGETNSISFQQIFDNSQMASIILFDENGIILNSNLGVLKSYGYAPEDLIGKHFSMLFTKEDQLKNLPDIELSKVHQRHFASDQNYIVHKDGSPIWSHGESVYTKDDKGKTVVVKLIYDINFQKIQERYLITANEELTRINQDLDSFVYSASHDLKAPISNIEALINMIEGELKEGKTEDLPGIVEMLKTSVDKFKKTIADLTITGREIANLKDIKPIQFSEVIKEIKKDLQEEIKKSEASFVEDYEKAPFIRISTKNLRSILYNLISNAIKYRSKRKPEVKIITEKSNEYITIEVADNGLGIKKEDKNKVFGLYTRLHTHVEGTGVGMNLVKNIVDNANGKIEIESEEGKGSSFKIFIPIN